MICTDNQDLDLQIRLMQGMVGRELFNQVGLRSFVILEKLILVNILILMQDIYLLMKVIILDQRKLMPHLESTS